MKSTPKFVTLADEKLIIITINKLGPKRHTLWEPCPLFRLRLKTLQVQHQHTCLESDRKNSPLDPRESGHNHIRYHTQVCTKCLLNCLRIHIILLRMHKLINGMHCSTHWYFLV